MNLMNFTFEGPWIFNAIIVALVGYFVIKVVINKRK